MADLDALAIAQALTAVDPRWGEPTGSARGLVVRHDDRSSCVVIWAAPDRTAAADGWICATVTMRGDWRYRDRTLDALREAIWGPDGYVYITYRAEADDAVSLVGRADGQPSPTGPP